MSYHRPRGAIRLVPENRQRASVGDRFGRLVIIGQPFYLSGATQSAVCQCECGGIVCTQIHSLRKGLTRSCGCFRPHRRSQPIGSPGRIVHGQSCTRLYRIWSLMLSRCRNKAHNRYKYYGGRGIAVCESWHKFEEFRDWAMSHGYSDDLTIDRIDSDGNYEPINCQWITLSENSRKAHSDRKAKGAVQKDGSSYSFAKLTDEAVFEMRRLRSNGMSYRQLASKFGVCHRTASNVCTGVSWKTNGAAWRKQNEEVQGG